MDLEGATHRQVPSGTRLPWRGAGDVMNLGLDSFASAFAKHACAWGASLRPSWSGSCVADAPHDFESRLERTLPELRRLVALVPERHDLVLMKTLRCYEHDLEAIVELHTVVERLFPEDIARLEIDCDGRAVDRARALTARRPAQTATQNSGLSSTST